MAAGFAHETWTAGYMLLVAAGAAWRVRAGGLLPVGNEAAAAAGACWALWAGAALAGRGRMAHAAAGWLFAAASVVAAAAVLWPERLLAASIQPLLLLWAGMGYRRLLAGWSALLLLAPVSALAAAYALSDIAGSGGRWLLPLCGPLAPLFGKPAIEAAAVAIYAAPALAARLLPAIVSRPAAKA